MPPARAMFRGIGVQYGSLSAAGGNVIFSGIQRQGNLAPGPLRLMVPFPMTFCRLLACAMDHC